MTERIKNGFLTRGPAMAMDSFRPRDEEDPDTLEIHNHIDPDYGALVSEEMSPRDRGRRDAYSDDRRGRYQDDRRDRLRDDEEEPDDDGVIARYPEDYSAEYEDGELVIRSRPSSDKTTVHEMGGDPERRAIGGRARRALWRN
jgi:hypothetical protein